MQSATASPVDSPAGTTFEILLVEDHPAVLDSLSALLRRAFPFWRISGVASAEEAIESCRAMPPELVVMDIGLPGMNGIDATRVIKGISRQIQVVMHSSNDADIFRAEAAAAGASAFVAKGRDSSRLVAEISSLMPLSALRA